MYRAGRPDRWASESRATPGQSPWGKPDPMHQDESRDEEYSSKPLFARPGDSRDGPEVGDISETDSHAALVRQAHCPKQNHARNHQQQPEVFLSFEFH